MHALVLVLMFSQVADSRIPEGSPPGQPQTEFARRVAAEIPEWKDADDDWERVGLLRTWAWSNTDFVHQRSVGKEGEDNPFHFGNPENPLTFMRTRNVVDFYNGFRDRGRAVWISECAIGLSWLYHDFGYRAGQLRTGTETYLGANFHAQTLVEIMHRGKPTVVLQDPTFNITLEDRTAPGEPVDYCEFVKRLARREHNRFRVVGPDYTTTAKWPRMYYPDEFVKGRSADEIQRGLWMVLDGVYAVENVNGNMLFHSPRTLDKWLQFEAWDATNGQPKIIAEITKYGYPPHWLYLHLLRRGFSSGIKTFDKSIDQQIANAIRCGETERAQLTASSSAGGTAPQN